MPGLPGLSNTSCERRRGADCDVFVAMTASVEWSAIPLPSVRLGAVNTGAATGTHTLKMSCPPQSAGGNCIHPTDALNCARLRCRPSRSNGGTMLSQLLAGGIISFINFGIHALM